MKIVALVRKKGILKVREMVNHYLFRYVKTG